MDSWLAHFRENTNNFSRTVSASPSTLSFFVNSLCLVVLRKSADIFPYISCYWKPLQHQHKRCLWQFSGERNWHTSVSLSHWRHDVFTDTSKIYSARHVITKRSNILIEILKKHAFNITWNIELERTKLQNYWYRFCRKSVPVNERSSKDWAWKFAAAFNLTHYELCQVCSKLKSSD